MPKPGAGTATRPRDRAVPGEKTSREQQLTHPSAPREPLVETLHGRRVADPYRWLEDPADPRTRAFVTEQERHFQSARNAWQDHGRWRQAVLDCTQSAPVAPPVIRGSRHFFLTQHAHTPDPLLVIADTRTGKSSSLDLGGLSAAAGGGKGVVRGLRPSWEGDRVACLVSTGGSDTMTLHVIDTDGGAPAEAPLGPLPAAWVAWLPGGEAFYYVAPAGFPSGPGDDGLDLRVRLHRVGERAEADPVVFGEGMLPGSYYGLTIDPKGEWLAVAVSRGAAGRNSLWTASLRQSTTAPSWRQVTGDSFDGAVAPRFAPDGKLLLMTDAGAPRGRICVADAADPRPERWQELVPEDPEAVLDDCLLLSGPDGPVALVLRTRHGISELTACELGGRPRSVAVDLPGAGLVSALRASPAGGGEAWLVYSDFATPGVLCRYDVRGNSLHQCGQSPDGYPAPDGPRSPDGQQPSAQPTVPGPRRPSTPRVCSQLVGYPARDGTTVRMFVLSAEHVSSGPRPTIVSGYGGFGVPMRPVYSPVILAWVAAGGRYAIACVRGGGEEGKAWHHAGRGENKAVAVDDFVAAAEWLVQRGDTEPDMLAAAGASHGGFLAAAAATRRPDLYAAVLCSDPLLDLVRYERLGLGPTWTEEFGSAGDPRQLANLLELSPYHQVRPGTRYPAVLFSGGTYDPRLDAAHVRKMCAALQHAAQDPERVLMRREAGVGHGTRPWESTLELNADTLAFLAAHTQLGLPEQQFCREASALSRVAPTVVSQSRHGRV